MTEIQNPKQKTIAHAAQAPALRVEPVLNLWFVIWRLEFVILDTKLQGRAGELWPGPKDQVFQGKIKIVSFTDFQYLLNSCLNMDAYCSEF